MSKHYESTTTKTDWVTPRETIEALGPFDLDPCAGHNLPWFTAHVIYTGSHVMSEQISSRHGKVRIVTDGGGCGLSREWEGTVWLNPPYGKKEIEPWLVKMTEHGNGIALLPARMETRWFQELVFPHATAILYRKGRINFCDRQGNTVSGNTIGSVFVAYGWDMVGRLANNIDNPHVGNGGHLEVIGE